MTLAPFGLAPLSLRGWLRRTYGFDCKCALCRVKMLLTASSVEHEKGIGGSCAKHDFLGLAWRRDRDLIEDDLSHWRASRMASPGLSRDLTVLSIHTTNLWPELLEKKRKQNRKNLADHLSSITHGLLPFAMMAFRLHRPQAKLKLSLPSETMTRLYTS